MGILADIKALSSVQRIKNGGFAYISISSITTMITNMQDAKKNLSVEQFNAVHKQYLELRACKSKLKLDYDAYLHVAIDIIKKLNAIAPYEQYSGHSALETSFLMQEINEETN